MRKDTDTRHRDRLRTVHAYIARQLGEDCAGLGLTDIARAAQTAPHYLHRIFRAHTGEPLHQYVRDLRLHLAAYQLIFSDVPVSEVAQRSGYASNAAFTKAFRASFDAAPSTLRGTPGGEVPPVRLPSPRRAPGPSGRIAFLRHFGGYHEVTRVWDDLQDRLTRAGLDPHRLEAFGIVHDGPLYCLSKRVRYDACVRVDPTFVPTYGLGVQALPDQVLAATPAAVGSDLTTVTHIRLAVRTALEHGASTVRPVPFYELYTGWPASDAATVEVAVVVTDQG